METFSIALALMMGLAGSLHCAGMCGPIIWVMPFQVLRGYNKWFGIALYHFARISMYALMGLMLHSFSAMFHPQWQQYVSIALGIVLLVIGVISFIPGKRSFELPWAGFVKSRLGRFIGSPSLSSLFISGMLNGLLPCGLVYMALSAAATAATPLQSILLMYTFGAGTLPVLIALTALKSKASFLRIQQVKKLVPAVMLVFGCIFVLRGMNLGIPYLSPEVQIEQQVVKSSCCHKH
ncbi:MAG: sulfite exporter TauE/SafE family protein [Sphingobacteriales bacterium]|nr:MAG: sulfite exporter TauE/SafE family protein [Sphingobacteriales bacterium]